MSTLKLILTIVYAIVCVALIVVVLMQESKVDGLSGALVGGSGSTFWGKNKGRSLEGTLNKLTIILGAVFVVLSIVLQLKWLS